MNKIINKLTVVGSALVLMLGIWASFNRFHTLTPSELVEYAEDRIVVLNGPDNENSGGTGFAIIAPSGKTYTLTNRHVCGLARNGGIMSAQTKYHERRVLLRILEISQEHDLCLLEGMPNVRGYKLAAKPADMYEFLYTIGHPHLEPNTYAAGLMRGAMEIKLEAQVPLEKCSGPDLETMEISFFGLTFKICIQKMGAISTSMVIYPGNSGSPVFNSRHYVVGVIFAGNDSNHFGYYVPFEMVKRLLERY